MVTIIDSGERFPCTLDQTVLAGMRKLGRRGIPVGCCGGGCGVCRIKVVSGSYDCQAMSRAHISVDDEAAGEVLACRIKPKTDLSVRAIGLLGRRLARPEQ